MHHNGSTRGVPSCGRFAPSLKLVYKPPLGGEGRDEADLFIGAPLLVICENPAIGTRQLSNCYVRLLSSGTGLPARRVVALGI